MDVLKQTIIKELDNQPVATDNLYFDTVINKWLLPLSRKYDDVLQWKIMLINNPLKIYKLSEDDCVGKIITFITGDMGEISEQVTEKDIVLMVCDNYGVTKNVNMEYDSQMYIMTAFNFTPIEFFMEEKRNEVIPMIYTGTKAGRDILRVFRENTIRVFKKS